ncbi:unnamed protein product [Rhizopus stolonifer]
MSESNTPPRKSPTIEKKQEREQVSVDSNEQLLDHSHLKPGSHASLLSYTQTINMYRKNVKKANNMDIQCDFAIFLVEAAKRISEQANMERKRYLLESQKLLKQVAARGHSESQYYLANVPEFNKAFPLFIQSAKHHHPDAAYRAAKCYQDGLGTKKDKAKAVQYYRKAAMLNHPGAMYRLGLAFIKEELNLTKNVRDGYKWLKRSAEAANSQYPHALHELALLHEKGFDSIIFPDIKYAIHLYIEAAMLGYPPSAYRLGECYEFGKLDCVKNPALSVYYYTMAAEKNHSLSCFALTSGYLIGIPDVLPPSDEKAYMYAMAAAKQGLAKAQYAIGYFTEMGMGIAQDESLALDWYRQAAERGDKRAIERLNQQEIKQVNTKAKRTSFSSVCSNHSQSYFKKSLFFLKFQK